MSRQLLIVAGLVVTAWLSLTAHAAVFQTGAPACRPAGPLIRVAGLAEASGLAVSQTTPGRLWTHNDSGKPEIFALDTAGKITGRISVTGATVEDWEAIATAPCEQGTCLYVADIGDNKANRKAITVYRLPEPASLAGSVAVDAVLKASYPDGAQDAEALMAGPDRTLYIVTKGETGPVALYRFPRDLKTGTVMRLEQVGAPLSKRPAGDARITDAAVSPDGAVVGLRTRTSLVFYRGADFLNGKFHETGKVDLRPLGEPQGEAIAFGPSNAVYLAGESGGTSQSGTLSILTCNRSPG